MKLTHLFLSFLILSLVSSCADTQTKNSKLKAKIKSESPIDLSAKSAPMNGYNYYNLPDAAPKMEKKQQAAKNVKPAKKSAIKK